MYVMDSLKIDKLIWFIILNMIYHLETRMLIAEKLIICITNT